MKDWQLRQVIYHATEQNFSDIVGEHVVPVIDESISDEDLINLVALHFKENLKTLHYPAKSYFVAIVYAKLIAEHFGEGFLETLNDPSLLYNNDRFFVRYRQSKKSAYVYDSVLALVGEDFSMSSGQVPCVRRYFNYEFLIAEMG